VRAESFPGARVKLVINGEDRDVRAETLGDLIDELGGRRGCAAAVDGAVVPRSLWGDFALQPGQVLEVLTATQGG